MGVTAFLSLQPAEDPIAWFRRVAKAGGSRKADFSLDPADMQDVALALRLWPGQDASRIWARATAPCPDAGADWTERVATVPAGLTEATISYDGQRPLLGPTMTQGGRSRYAERVLWSVRLDPTDRPSWSVVLTLDFSEWEGEGDEDLWFEGEFNEYEWDERPQDAAKCRAWWDEASRAVARELYATLGISQPPPAPHEWQHSIALPGLPEPTALAAALRALAPEVVTVQATGPLEVLERLPLPAPPRVAGLERPESVALSKVGRPAGWRGSVTFSASLDWEKGMSRGWGAGEPQEDDDPWDTYGNDLSDLDVWLRLRADGADPYLAVNGGVTDEGAARIAALLGATLTRVSAG